MSDEVCKVAIVGAGPAGLTAAAMLREAGVPNVRIFDGDSRPGGKCLTVEHGGALHELGTCYTTIDHRIVNRWMRKLGIEQTRLGGQMMDGVPFVKYVSDGSRASLAAETARYLALWEQQRQAMRSKPHTEAQKAEWSMTIREWLHRHRLPRMERFMHRAITTLGYGLLDDVTVYQALRWCTPTLFLTGFLNELRMPITGWQDFWDKLAQALDVRLEEPVHEIDRNPAGGGSLVTAKGRTVFEHLIVAAPLDRFAATTPLSSAEQRVAESFEWGTYVITLAEIDGWFESYTTDAFSDAAAPGAHGRLLGARIAPARMRSAPHAPGNDTYLLAQQHFGNYSEAGLANLLEEGVAARGGKFKSTVAKKSWRYFPRYRPDAIREGMLDWMVEIQGSRNTWFTGSSFSHEAVSSVANFNERLVRQMLPRLRN